MPSLWVVVQWRDRLWAGTLCNLEPEPPPFVSDDGTGKLSVLLGMGVRHSWFDAGDGKGHRRWGCDLTGRHFGPGLHEIELLEIDGVEGSVRSTRPGWVGKLVPMSEG